MSINNNRTARRLAATEEAIKEVVKQLKSLHFDDKALRADWQKLVDAITALDAKIRAMTKAHDMCSQHLEAWKGKEDAVDYPKAEIELDLDQIKAADESLAMYNTDMAELIRERDAAWKDISVRAKALEVEIAAVDNRLAALLVVQAEQTSANERMIASYPQRLKSHLRRCANNGFADSPMRAGKKS